MNECTIVKGKDSMRKENSVKHKTFFIIHFKALLQSQLEQITYDN